MYVVPTAAVAAAVVSAARCDRPPPPVIMTYHYSHPAPFHLYAYAQMPIPNHEIYAVYPGGSHLGSPMEGAQPFYYEPSSKGYSQSGK